MFVVLPGSRISGFALRRLPQKLTNDWIKRDKMLCDAARAADKVADESIEIVDQPLLIGDNCSCIRMLKLDAASDARHECLGVFGETFEHSNQITQGLMNFCIVEDGILREVTQNL
ncbi:hypothetical protein ACVWW6_002789 [Bradyrhizobium sp. USDA 3311]